MFRVVCLNKDIDYVRSFVTIDEALKARDLLARRIGNIKDISIVECHSKECNREFLNKYDKKKI